MSDTLRMTGLYSGLDTESIIESLVSTKSQKVTDLKNEQKKLEWTQTVWQDLNSQIYSLYSKTLSNLRFTSGYTQKTTKISDSTKATIVASDSAVNGTQTLQISKTAKAGYLTGANLATKYEKDTKDTTKINATKQSLTSSSKLTDIGAIDESLLDKSIEDNTITIKVGKGTDAKKTDIKITSDMTISTFVSKLKEAGVNASFDETNQRFFISSTDTGEANEFELTSTASDGKTVDNTALKALGIYVDDSNADTSAINKYTYNSGSIATRVYAQDAEIVLNGATFTSSSNTFTVNGLTITANDVTAANEELSISTETDYDGIYNTIKDFLSEYNEIINKMYKLYNADSARKYSMLTDDQKEEMTDDEVEEWEDKIKSALLRKDSTLYTVMEAMRKATTTSYTVDGKKLYLSNFGIGTLSYFSADENERYALHIDGDPDDENTSSNDDKLKTMLSTNLDGTIEFFTSMCKNMYDLLYATMGSTDYSSIYKVYDDKRLKDEYDDYDDKISDAEDELSDYEDYWYDKFSSMETALANLQSTQNVVSSMLGTSS
jgi:flagellar hook-associated protein 2